MKKINWKDDIVVLGYYFKLSWQHDKLYIIFMLFSSLISALIPVINVVMLKFVVDELIGDKDLMLIIEYVSLGVICSFIFDIIISQLKKIISKKSQLLVSLFEMIIAKKIMSIEFEKMDNPEMLNKKEKALYPVRNQNAIKILINNTALIIQNLCTAIGLILVISTLDIWIIVFIIALLAVNIYVYTKIQAAEFDFFQILIKDNREMSYYSGLTRDFSYGKDIRIYRLSEFLRKKINKYIEKSTSEFRRANKKVGKYTSFKEVLERGGDFEKPYCISCTEI